MPNIRQALQFSLTDNPTAALQMTNTMRLIWAAHGMVSEARRWQDLALAAVRVSPARSGSRRLAGQRKWPPRKATWRPRRPGSAEGHQLLAVIDDPVARGVIN